MKQNLYKVDDILKIFADQNGEINPQEILVEYAQQIGDNGITIDIRDYINNDMLKNMRPNKILIIKKEDILNLIV